MDNILLCVNIEVVQLSNLEKLFKNFEFSNFEDDPTEQMWSDYFYGECCECIFKFDNNDWFELERVYPSLNDSTKILLVQVLFNGPCIKAFPIVVDCLASNIARLYTEALDALNEKYECDNNYYKDIKFDDTVIKLILDKNFELTASRYYDKNESKFISYIRSHT